MEQMHALCPAVIEPSQRYTSVCRRRFCDRVIAELGGFEFARRVALQKEAEQVECEIFALLTGAGASMGAADLYLAELAESAEAVQQILWEMHRRVASGH